MSYYQGQGESNRYQGQGAYQEEEEELTPEERRVAMQEIADHERLSQPFRKINLSKAFAVAGISAATCGTIAAVTALPGGPFSSLTAGGIAAASCGAKEFVGKLVSDATAPGHVEGTMEPSDYSHRGNPYYQNTSALNQYLLNDAVSRNRI